MLQRESDGKPQNRLVLERATPDQLSRFTPDQLALLGKNADEIQREAYQFSFDVEAFVARLATGETWHQVIQGHLYLDHIVTAMLLAALQRPDAVQLSRMGFAQRLELIEAMGLLPSDMVSAVSAVNKLRNRIAHQLDFEISPKDVRDLRNATPKWLRETSHGKSGAKGMTVPDLLQVIVLMVDTLRQKQTLARLENEQGALTLRMTLDQLVGRRNPRE